MIVAGQSLADFHMHTVYSDGSSEPEALLEAVAAAGVKTVAVTDHDTTAAYERLVPTAERLGLELIKSIEINTHWGDEDVHILGYYVDSSNDYLQEVMEQHQAARRVQIKQMVEKIASLTNINIHPDEVLAQSHPQGSLGRPHVAKVLFEKRAVKTIGDAFGKYLRSNCSTYVTRPTVTPHEAVEAIYSSGGIPVVAHPGLCHGIEKLIPELMAYGLYGLEAYHKGHIPPVVEYFCQIAEKHDLIITGGTDFHGLPPLYAQSHAKLHAPNHLLETLKEAHRQRHQAYAMIA
ncbi:MAG: PHP domain-containing protein [Vampirovibrionales bacterium]